MASPLAKIESLPIKIVCPVHGPILRSDVGRYLEKYRAWSAEPPRGNKKRLPVFYVSSYGNTERMAHAVGRGIRAAGADADVLDLTKVDYRAMLDDMETAEGIVVGTCTINGDALEQARACLIKQVYEVNPLVCPRCAGPLRLIVFIEQPEVIDRLCRARQTRKILTHLWV